MDQIHTDTLFEKLELSNKLNYVSRIHPQIQIISSCDTHILYLQIYPSTILYLNPTANMNPLNHTRLERATSKRSALQNAPSNSQYKQSKNVDEV